MVARLARPRGATAARARWLVTVMMAVVVAWAALTAPARAAFPGRNGVIAYIAPDEAPGAVWTVDPVTGARAVLAGVLWAGDPAWSEDGRKLAFAHYAGHSGRLIGVLPASRPATRPWGYDDIQELTRPGRASAEHPFGVAADDWDPTWAPGGRRLAYRHANADQLVVVDANGTNQQVIADDANADGPAWSTDGRLIAFTRCQPPNATQCSLWTITPEGRDPRQITIDALDARAPSWSPDGRQLAFAAQGAIWTIQLGPRQPAAPRRILADGTSPAWSPDGTHIAFVRFDPNGSLYVARRDGTGARHVPTPGQWVDAIDAKIDWQPGV